MTQPLEPLRMLSTLRAHGVGFVLVGDTAMAARGGPIDFEVVEICIPEDPQNLRRVCLALQTLGAIPVGPDAADRSSYDTTAGGLDVIELREGFADLSARASDEDLGNGLVARVASVADLTEMARNSGDLAVAVTLIALEGDDESRLDEHRSDEHRVEEHHSMGRRSVEHEDEFGPTREVRTGPRWVDRLLIRLEGVDDFLTRTVYHDEHEIRS
jgi:hypothetical protein